MDNEIKQFTYMSLELLVSSIVMTAIILVVVISGKFVQAKEANDLGASLVKVQADFYTYMQKGDDLSCSDVMDIITAHAKIYNFAVVEKEGTVVKADLLLRTSYDLDKWSLTNLRENLSDNFKDNYRMVQVLTLDGDSLLGIAFLNSKYSWSEDDYASIKSTLGIGSKTSYKD